MRKYRMNGRVVNVSSASDKSGFIVRLDNGDVKFRMYSEDSRKFVDFSILHDNVMMKIVDPSAFLYRDEDNNLWIDFSPSTLELDDYVEDENENS